MLEVEALLRGPRPLSFFDLRQPSRGTPLHIADSTVELYDVNVFPHDRNNPCLGIYCTEVKGWPITNHNRRRKGADYTVHVVRWTVSKC